jgi:XTP/dITP diphosphohydrolase
MTQQFLVATHNPGKVQEFATLLADLNLAWLGLADLGITLDVAETGTTFYENAVLKARGYAAESGLITLADDSGLEVDGLNGRPGVQTARYGGEGLTHAQRYQKLLSELLGLPWDERTARFRCVIVVARPDGALLGSTEGICEGLIAEAPAGTGGFGYDPVFFLPDRQKTLAQLLPAAKNQISHRGRALQKIEPLLRQLAKGSEGT